MRLYVEVARATYRQMTTYRGATFAGIVTNTVFGFILAYVMLAVFRQRPVIGGFDAIDAVTFTFVTQGLLMVVGIFGRTDQGIRTSSPQESGMEAPAHPPHLGGSRFQVGALMSRRSPVHSSAGSGEPPTIAVHALQERLRGQIIRPGDDEYDHARQVWNAVVDRRPALIVRPRDVAGVIEAVDVARTHDVRLAVRGGGHSPAGYGTVDGGIVVDLSTMKRLDIDPEQRVASAEPGLNWGEYNARTHDYGLATPGGDVAALGVAGLTLGGGMGWLMRKHGMTIDNVLEVDVVTAGGRLLTASEAEHPDLFWALRGGGGNVGIATGFRYRLHPVKTVLGGAIVHPATREGLRAYAEATAAEPDELTTITLMLKAPPLPFIPADAHGTPVHVILPAYTGDLDAGQQALAPLRALAGRTPLVDTTGPMPYPGLYSLTDMGAVRRPHVIRNAFLRELTDEAIDIMLDFLHRATSPYGAITLRELGGAMARVPVDATAFAHRDKAFYIAADNSWDDEPQPERHVAWTDAFLQAVAPYTDGAYAGFLDDEGQDRIRAAYPPATYTRLAAVKRRYDPDNLFRLNPNVRPA